MLIGFRIPWLAERKVVSVATRYAYWRIRHRVLIGRRSTFPAIEPSVDDNGGATVAIIPLKGLWSWPWIDWHRTGARPYSHPLPSLRHNFFAWENGRKPWVVLTGGWLAALLEYFAVSFDLAGACSERDRNDKKG